MDDDNNLGRQALKQLLVEASKDRAVKREGWSKLWVTVGGVITAVGIALAALIKGCGGVG
jgi:hypothetical protein